MFQKTYGGSADIEATHSVVQAPDNGYIMAGVTKSFGAGGWDVCLAKTDSMGVIQWSTAIGGLLEDYCFAVERTYDDNYVIAGYTKSAGAGEADALLLKVDPAGNLLWAKTWGGLQDDGFFSVEQTSDGGFILLGWTSVFGFPNDEAYLVKTDSAGNTEWTKTYGGIASDVGESVIQTSEGGFLLAGHTYSFGVSGEEGYVIKTDAAGNLLWSKTYGAISDEVFYAVKELAANNGYILLGTTNSFTSGDNDIWLTKIDLTGNVVWSQKYSGSANHYDSGFSLDIKSNNEFLIAGPSTSFGAGDNNACLLCTDTSGIIIWSQIYGPSSPDQVRSCKQTSDGGCILAGYTEYNTGAGLGNFFSLKPMAQVTADVTKQMPLLSLPRQTLFSLMWPHRIHPEAYPASLRFLLHLMD